MPSSSAHSTGVRKPVVIRSLIGRVLPPFKPFGSIESDDEDDDDSAGFADTSDDICPMPVGQAAGQPDLGNSRLSVRPGPVIHGPDGRDALSDDEVIFVGSTQCPPQSGADKPSRSKICPNYSPSGSSRKPIRGLLLLEETSASGSASHPIELLSSPPGSPSARISSHNFLASEEPSPKFQHNQPHGTRPGGQAAGLDIDKRAALVNPGTNRAPGQRKVPGAEPVASLPGMHISLPQLGPTWCPLPDPARSPTRLAGSASHDTDLPVQRPREAQPGPDKSHLSGSKDPGAGPDTPRPYLPMTPSTTPDQALPMDAPGNGLDKRPAKSLDALKDGLDRPPVKHRIVANPPATQPDESGQYEASTCHQCRVKTTRPKMICDRSQNSNCVVRVCEICLMVKTVYDGIPDLRPPLFEFVPGGTMLCVKCRHICPCASCRRSRGEPEVCRRGLGEVLKGSHGKPTRARRNQKLQALARQKEKEAQEAEATVARRRQACEERHAAAVQQRQEQDATAMRLREKMEAAAMRQKQEALARQKEDAIVRRKQEKREALAVARRAEEEQEAAAVRQRKKPQAAAVQQAQELETPARRVQEERDAVAVGKRHDQQAEAARQREEHRVQHRQELNAAKRQKQNEQPSIKTTSAGSRAEILSSRRAYDGSEQPQRAATMPLLLSPSSKSRNKRWGRLTLPESQKKQKRPDASEAWQLDREPGAKKNAIGCSDQESDDSMASDLRGLPPAFLSHSKTQDLLPECVSHKLSHGALKNQQVAVCDKKAAEEVELKRLFAPLASSSHHTINNDDKPNKQGHSKSHKSRSRRKKERKALENEIARLELEKRMEKKLKKKRARKHKRINAEKIAAANHKAQMIQGFIRAGLSLQEAIATSENLLKEVSGHLIE